MMRRRSRRVDTGTRRAGPADEIVGLTIRTLRLAKRMTQGELARKLGLAFQQVQKYETGTNRVSAGRLLRIAEALEVPLDALLQGLDVPDRKMAPGEDPLALLANAQAMRLVQALAKIKNDRIRRSLVQLAEKVASEGR